MPRYVEKFSIVNRLLINLPHIVMYSVVLLLITQFLPVVGHNLLDFHRPSYPFSRTTRYQNYLLERISLPKLTKRLSRHFNATEFSCERDILNSVQRNNHAYLIHGTFI